MRTRLLLSFVFLFTVGCDQATKAYATGLPPGGTEVIPGFFSLVFTQNPGGAFSGFLWIPFEWRRLLLIALPLALVAWAGSMVWRAPREATAERTGWVLVMAGGIGNLIDRVRVGQVTDFILWHYQQYAWPVFNIADVAIAVGIGLLLFFRHRPAPAATV